MTNSPTKIPPCPLNQKMPVVLPSLLCELGQKAKTTLIPSSADILSATLDTIIGEFRKGKLDHEVRDILRVGVCQLIILRLPDHAAVHETVECARAPVRGLINAVLRKVAHSRARLLRELPDLPPATLYSHPQWLFKYWKELFGLENTLTLMDWNNQPAEAFYRPNPLNPPTEPSEQPRKEDLKAGHYYITDPSTRHSVELLAPQPGEIILDACAAPGGKATAMAGIMKNKGRLFCTDSNPKRLPRLLENLENMKVSIAETATHDWTTPAPADWQKRFDAILLDVPCSNTGVLRRRVDVRWRLQATDLDALVKLQRQIIEQALPCLKAGGRLLYSTCSIDPLENQQQVAWLTAAHPTLSLVKDIQVFPFKHQTDGAYAALLKKA